MASSITNSVLISGRSNQSFSRLLSGKPLTTSVKSPTKNKIPPPANRFDSSKYKTEERKVTSPTKKESSGKAFNSDAVEIESLRAQVRALQARVSVTADLES